MSRSILQLIHEKRWEEANSAILQSYSSESQRADQNYLLGVLAYFQGQISTALKHLKLCLEIQPKHTDAAVSLSVLYNDIGRYEDAKKVFELANESIFQKNSKEVLGIDKKFSTKHLELADLYYRYKRYNEALREYEKANQLDPTSLEIRVRFASALAQNGSLGRALEEFRLIRKENPKYIKARLQLVRLLHQNGQILDSETELDVLKKDFPEDREVQDLEKTLRKSRFGNLIPRH